MATYVRTREQREVMVGRVRVLSSLLGVALAVVVGSFWVVQGVHGAEYRDLAEHNRLRQLPIRAPRGVIYDRAGRPLAENVPSYNLRLQKRATDSVSASLAFAAGILETSPLELERILVRQEEKEPVKPVLLAENLTLSQVARFELASLEHPEFEIEVEQLRLYRHREQTAHVLGYLSEVTQDELATLGEAYGRGSLIGRRGIERQYEEILRGANGERVVVVDSRSRPVEEYRSTAATPGQDLSIALDLDLQQAATRALGEQVGSVVALDPRNGEVLAMVSTPSYDSNLFARRLDSEQWQQLLAAPHDPMQNRAIQNAHSPGSTFKIVMALAGMKEGLITPQTRVFCGGAASFYGRRFRCWKQGGHGSVDLYHSLKSSCDVYYYTLGQRLGIERIAHYAKMFGFGSPTGIDLAGEKAGLVPSEAWSQEVRKHKWYPGETISVSIGQGPLLVTPLQMAVATATIAVGGRIPTPQLALAVRPPRRDRLDFTEEAWEQVRRGMWGVVVDYGTGYNANVPGLEIGGKTGTVQVVAQHTWMKSHELPWAQRDHAWFTSFAPVDDPQIVVSVFVEHGGAGSQAAAPIARVVYEEFLKKHPELRRSPAAPS